ncbi:unnamed protein product, partial [Ectocarpus sp. 13 AM-2016]
PSPQGNLFKPVDPEGCTWQIDNPGPGQPKEVTITLLKAEPAKSREAWWRAPLKGLETRRPAPKPADPEMVSGGAGGGGGQQAVPGNTVTAAASNGNTPRSAAGTAGGLTPSAGVAAAGAGKPPAGAGSGEAAGAAAAGAAAAAAATPPSSQKSGKGGGKKKNRKKNCCCLATLELEVGPEVKIKQKRTADGWGQARRAPPVSVVAM